MMRRPLVLPLLLALMASPLAACSGDSPASTPPGLAPAALPPPGAEIELATPSAPIAPAATRHLDRQRWWELQRVYPGEGVPPGAYTGARKAWDALPHASIRGSSAPACSPGQPCAAPPPAPPPDPKTAMWTFLGPAPLDTKTGPLETPNMGPTAGRGSALAIDPTNPDILYAGYSMGGVWKSTDGGTTWKPLMDEAPSLAVGSIAIDPASPSTVYVGTGEAAFYAGYGGRGIYKSTDAGATWSRIDGSKFDGLAIPRLILDGADMYAAVTFGNAGRGETCNNAYYDTPGQGIFKSSDGGATWKLLKGGKMVDLEIDKSQKPYHLFASDFLTGVWRSTDGGTTWTQPAGLPTATGSPKARRPEIAIAPSDPTVVYVGTGVNSAATVFVSTDSGATFTEIPGAPNYCEAQCYYDNSVIVDSAQPGTVYVGGALCGVWKTSDGTAALPTWTNVSAPGNDCGMGDANWYLGNVHPDVHALQVDPQNPSFIYAITDGGLARSKDGGATWARLNDGVGTVQLYSICVPPDDPEVVYGGAQDNGSMVRPKGTLVWKGISSGDGGPCAIDAQNSKNVLLSTEEGTVIRSKSGFTKVDYTYVFNAAPDSCVPKTDPGCGDRVGFIAPVAADPTAAGTFYIGTQRVWRATDGGSLKGWKAISPDLTLGPNSVTCVAKSFPAFDDVLNAIVPAPSDSSTIYTGSQGGKLSRTTDGGATWTTISKAPLPARWVSGIAVDPTDSKTLWVAFSGFDTSTPSTPGHLFTSTDGGETWTKLDTGMDAPLDSLIAHPVAHGLLYAGTDFGVLVTTDGGKSFATLGDSLPNSAVYSLAFQKKSASLYAGTHGRSAWRLAFTPGALVADPASVTFTAESGKPDPASVTVTVSDDDPYGSMIDFTAATDAPWLTVAAPSSTAAGANGVPLAVNALASLQKVGEYDGKITITPATGTPLSVAVHLSIKAPASASTSSSSTSGGSSDQGGCGCEAAGSPGGGAFSLVALGALGMLAGRRRSRSARRRQEDHG